MLKRFLLIAAACFSCVAYVHAQEADVSALTPEEAAVVAAIKAQNADVPPVTPETPSDNQPAESAQVQTDAFSRQAAVSVPPETAPATPPDNSSAQPAENPHDDSIKLPEATKQQAFDEQKAEETAALAAQTPTAPKAAQPKEETGAAEEPEPPSKELQKCLTVAFIDIDEAFNQHPRTVAVKEQIHLKIVSKEQEVEAAKQIIDALNAENAVLSRQLQELKPFYRRIVVQPEMAPKIDEPADSLLLGNLLNQLCFSRCEILSTTPLNTPEQVDDIAARIATNKKIIAERSFFIDNYKYTTREEILKLEEKEVKAILKDIYTEIKSFAKKRNIGAVVRKDEILYGEKPVNVTKDFINRLKKSKKYRKMGY